MTKVNSAPLWCVWDMHKHQRDVTSLPTSKKLWQCIRKNINTILCLPSPTHFLLLLAVRLWQFVTHKFSINTHKNSTNPHNKQIAMIVPLWVSSAHKFYPHLWSCICRGTLSHNTSIHHQSSPPTHPTSPPTLQKAVWMRKGAPQDACRANALVVMWSAVDVWNEAHFDGPQSKIQRLLLTVERDQCRRGGPVYHVSGGERSRQQEGWGRVCKSELATAQHLPFLSQWSHSCSVSWGSVVGLWQQTVSASPAIQLQEASSTSWYLWVSPVQLNSPRFPIYQVRRSSDWVTWVQEMTHCRGQWVKFLLVDLKWPPKLVSWGRQGSVSGSLSNWTVSYH